MIPKQFYSYEAETVREILKDDVLAEKVLALRSLCGTDYPYRDIQVFNVCVMATNGVPVDADVLVRPELKFIEYTLRLIDRVCDTIHEFTPVLLKYLAFLCKDENLHWFPENFKLSMVNELIYRKGVTEQTKKAYENQDWDNPQAVKIKLIDIYCKQNMDLDITSLEKLKYDPRY